MLLTQLYVNYVCFFVFFCLCTLILELYLNWCNCVFCCFLNGGASLVLWAQTSSPIGIVRSRKCFPQSQWVKYHQSPPSQIQKQIFYLLITVATVWYFVFVLLLLGPSQEVTTGQRNTAYCVKHYMIKFVCNLRQVGGFHSKYQRLTVNRCLIRSHVPGIWK
jgi:hypothetical protein